MMPSNELQGERDGNFGERSGLKLILKSLNEGGGLTSTSHFQIRQRPLCFWGRHGEASLGWRSPQTRRETMANRTHASELRQSMALSSPSTTLRRREQR